MRLLSLCFLISLSAILSAQIDSLPQLVFQISAKRALELYQGDQIKEQELRQLPVVDSFLHYRDAKSLNPGHYINLTVEGEWLQLAQTSQHNHKIHLFNDGKKLRVQISDKAGQIVTKAKLWFNDKQVSYNSENLLFEKKVGREGLLLVDVAGDSLFYQITAEQNRSLLDRRLRRIGSNRVIHYIATPYRFVKRSVNYFKRGIGDGNWYVYHRPWKNWAFWAKPNPIWGYLTTNQPKYRPGDTLRIAAYASKKSGRPWKSPMTLRIFEGYQRSPMVDTIIQPQGLGQYAFDFNLADSLKLDQRYRIELDHPKKKKVQHLTSYFRLEDYELEDFKFELSSVQEKFGEGELVRLEASAKDNNGQPVFGSRIQLTVLLDDFTDPQPDSLVLADTLWQTWMDLEDQISTEIIIPDSIFPFARTNATAKALWVSPSGETEIADCQFTVGGARRHYSLELEGDTITAKSWLNGKLTNDQFQLVRVSDSGSSKTKIRSPYKEPVSPFNSHYEIYKDDRFKAELLLVEEKDLVQISPAWQEDSIKIHFLNPRSLNIKWQLFGTQGLVQEGELTKKEFTLAKKANQSRYWIHYHYAWAGKVERTQREIVQYKKLLQVELETPSQIYPGQSQQISVTVKDYKGRPVANSALSAGAYTDRFDEKIPVEMSGISYRYKKAPFVRYTYDSELKGQNELRPAMLNSYWYQRLRLSKHLFYRMRYSAEELFQEVLKTTTTGPAKNWGQISPFLLENNRAKPIYMIYLDNQLVYYYQSRHQTPYSIVAKPGRHKLSIRTLEGEYKFNIDVKAGEHKVLAFNLDKSKKDLQYSKKPNHLTHQERNLLHRSIFRLRALTERSPTYFWMDSTRVQKFAPKYYNQPHLIGPFNDRSMVNYLSPGKDSFDFRFEPGYAYKFERGRDRLYAENLFQENKFYELPTNLDQIYPGESAIFPSAIENPTPKQKELRLPKKYGKIAFGSFGKLKLAYAKPFTVDSLSPITILLSHQDSNYHQLIAPIQTDVRRLPPGKYQIVWFLPNKKVRVHFTEVYAFKTTFNRLDLDSLPSMPIDISIFPDLDLYDYLYKKSELSKKQSKTPTTLTGPEVYGKVTDAETGEPLIVCYVQVVGTNIGTETDFDGNYRLNVPTGQFALEISYVGYQTKKILVDYPGKIDIKMSESASLDEVLVVAYRIPLVQQDNTTSAMTITSEEIRNLPTRNINAITAKAAGVTISGKGDAITLRGSRTAATNYYIDGIKVSFNNPGIPTPGGIRGNFSDYAYFLANLRTDRNGQATFQVSYPDDITTWNNFVAAAHKGKRGGMGQSTTQSYLPLQAQLSLPRFLVAGDQFAARARVSNFTGDSLSIKTFFRDADGQVLKTEQVDILTGWQETLKIDSPNNQDSLELTYGLEMPDFTDGERRQIGIYPVGRNRTIGYFLNLDADTSLIWPPVGERLQVDQSQSPIELSIYDNALSILKEEINYLKQYPWGCTEQTASRLQALLAEKEIAKWKNEAYPNEARIRAALSRLAKLQNQDGSWGWWKDNPASDWLTLHVLKTLKHAKKLGYSSTLDVAAERYLLNRINRLSSRQKLLVLTHFAEWGNKLNYENDYPELDTIDWQGYERLAYQRLRQLNGDTIALDSLYRYQKLSQLDGLFWGNNHFHYWSPRRDNHAQTLLAYRILRDAGQKEATTAIQRHLLQGGFGRPPSQQNQLGYNTLESAEILATLLPDLLTKGEGVKSRSVQYTSPGSVTKQIETFPAKLNLTASQMNGMLVSKKGTGPVFLMAQQTYFEQNPKPEDNGYTISSKMMQNGKKVNKLEQGQPAQLLVDIESDAVGEYLMIQIPIPAGCSFAERGRRYGEAHREYRRDRLAIFLNKLPAGKHQFKVELEPRFSGSFTLNPAQVELMYVPVVNGATGLNKIKIE